MSLNKSLIAGLLFIPALAFALPEDRQQPINIRSDTADIDNKKGISIYRGDVIVTQGTTRIVGDTVTVFTSGQEVTKVTAQGKKKRAYYEELQANAQGTVQAWGYTIHYSINKDEIELIRDAQLTQQGDTFKGDKINYDLAKQTVNAKGSQSQSDGGRVQMVIQPKQATTTK
ncbi:lipopolysaccharide transport periplasmic protein LptA [Endozoicomonas ascidiicola]|uniref:lipopolysaccharide transport periplasmic protein LptA n=1 Tax=Endozoicomonas ascidiicola TaxID=1698521 RepID=UPI000833075B|nr:lipopolysaccharide transport periplasmic protein LptA [Endozoicomonas ascidiicola]